MTWAAQATLLAVGLALTLFGVSSAFIANNVWKRLGGVLAALMGAAIGSAGLGAEAEAPIAIAAIAFAYCALGAALSVRIQEAYSGVEAPALDRADADEELREPSA